MLGAELNFLSMCHKIQPTSGAVQTVNPAPVLEEDRNLSKCSRCCINRNEMPAIIKME
jgi:hypothetical protein